RRGAVLRVIVREYIDKASPVGSAHVARAHSLGVSAATIRNEMAALEDEGYITHPHTSAGRIPSDKGYRYFVEALMETDRLPGHMRQAVQARILEVEGEPEEWAVVATSFIAGLAEALALVTFPRARAARVKHLELVALQDFLALLVLVLQEARVKQQLLHVDEAVTQDELFRVANRLNASFNGSTAQQISQQSLALNPLEERVTRTVTKLMEAEDARTAEVAQLAGMRSLLSQPEFASNERTLGLMDLVEDRRLLGSLVSQMAGDGDVRVFIGSENPTEAMRDYALILAPYGIPGEIQGTLGVLGPTRMHYARAIAAVSFLSGVMSEALTEHYG
ncbi:MAG: Heat-inducible transcription repressor HrcA, partial [Dehalococcoidia bacterium]|nr:Heat-inducible transcription repressor HrcA [Dehalococcoidia bacterium]